ncbi:aldo/keto reductase [Nakamurella endophytica]|uniref:Oxidoreductase n=1 Tax=Nakamurella endophytica TaxID=1748367 RepID=A0A917TBZ6_9ACTN|nr:aldo/keto reductase [Nakamurella endophytica]GGM17391.1 oxidoreductase [Nakamurella endophytica]
MTTDLPAAPRLGLGLAAIGRPAYITRGRAADLGDPATRSVEALRDRAQDLLDDAWAAGIRYFDAARSYGAAEQFLGSWLAEHPDRRPAVTVGSKWGYEYVGGWRTDAAVHERKDHSPAMFDRQWPLTVSALGGEPDVYLVHSVTPESPALGDPALLGRLRRLADRGVRVGLSTSGPAQRHVLAQALALPDGPFTVVQCTWNLLEQSAGEDLGRAHAAGWLVVVKEVLANGRLTDSAALPSVARLAAADGQTMDAFAIGAALARPWADVVLSGAVTPQQLASNARARVPDVTGERLRAIAVSPQRYWTERSALAWT